MRDCLRSPGIRFVLQHMDDFRRNIALFMALCPILCTSRNVSLVGYRAPSWPPEQKSPGSVRAGGLADRKVRLKSQPHLEDVSVYRQFRPTELNLTRTSIWIQKDSQSWFSQQNIST